MLVPQEANMHSSVLVLPNFELVEDQLRNDGVAAKGLRGRHVHKLLAPRRVPRLVLDLGKVVHLAESGLRKLGFTLIRHYEVLHLLVNWGGQSERHALPLVKHNHSYFVSEDVCVCKYDVLAVSDLETYFGLSHAAALD